MHSRCSVRVTINLPGGPGPCKEASACLAGWGPWSSGSKAQNQAIQGSSLSLSLAASLSCLSRPGMSEPISPWVVPFVTKRFPEAG